MPSKIRRMTNNTVFPSILSMFFLLPGCAVITKDECLKANWYQRGYENGVNGKLSLFTKLNETCLEYGVNTANGQQYMDGRLNGLKLFCTPEQGYKAGLNGKVYHNVCEPKSEKAFIPAYKLGKERYDQRQKVKKYQSRIDTLKSNITSWNNKKYEIQSSLLSSQDQDERQKLLNELNRIDNDISNAYLERQTLYDRLNREQRILEAMPKTKYD